MIVGMTGARDGMTPIQKVAFMTLMVKCGATELHHGDCVGADADAHDIACKLGLHIVIHPPTNPEYRAYCDGDVILKEKGYLQRNRDIVNASAALFGAPRGMTETGGGTWYTINYGKKGDNPVRIVYPDGSVEKAK